MFRLGSDNIHPGVRSNKTPTVGVVFLLGLSIKAFGKVLYYFSSHYPAQQTLRESYKHNSKLALLEPEHEWTEEQESHRMEKVFIRNHPPQMYIFFNQSMFFCVLSEFTSIVLSPLSEDG